MTSARDRTWQDNVSNAREALCYAYKHALFDDITIQTTDDTGSSMCFCAHKMVLATRSPVFADMFYSKTHKNGIISMNISPRALDIILWYVYSDAIEAEDIDELLESCDVASQYQITGFSEFCVEKLLQLSSSLRASNVFSVMEIATQFNSNELQLECLHFVENDPENVFLSEGFLSIPEKTLCKVLENINIKLCPKPILTSVIKWMLKNNLTDKRFLSVIDFALFTADDFLNTVEEFKNFFSKDEILCITSNLMLPESTELPPWCKFSKTKERCIKMPPSLPYEVMEIIKEKAVKIQTDCNQRVSKFSFFSFRGFQQDLLLKVSVHSRALRLVMIELAFGCDYVPLNHLKVELYSNTGSGRKMKTVSHYLISSRGHYCLLPSSETMPESGNSFNLLLSVEATELNTWGLKGPVSNMKYRAALVSNVDTINLNVLSNKQMVPRVSLKPFAEWLLFVDPKCGEKKFIVSALYFDTLKNAQKYRTYLEKGLR